MDDICSKCGVSKATDLFVRRTDTKKGYSNTCLDCRKTYNRRYTAEYGYKVRDYKLRSRYGINTEEWDLMFNKQNGKCDICKEIGTNKNQFGINKLAVDHCHKTGKVRGLLCNNCNQALGKLKDNIDVLNNAIEYLKRSL